MNESSSSPIIQCIDIGVNLTDGQFRGKYRGNRVHEDDFNLVMERAAAAGVNRMLITGGSLTDSKAALSMARSFSSHGMFSTVGCHPTRCKEFAKGGDAYYEGLLQLCRDGKDFVCAIGECGLDYDRLFFCEKEIQLQFFRRQFELANVTGLPMFFHCRSAFVDFCSIVQEYRSSFNHGVVHSFDGTAAELQQILDLGLYIGINGCSLKTTANLEVAATIPLDKLLIETDAPWCDVRPTHAGWNHVKTILPQVNKKERFEAGKLVKGRNEPANIIQVLEVIAGIKGISTSEVAKHAYQNTMKLFFPSECHEHQRH